MSGPSGEHLTAGHLVRGDAGPAAHHPSPAQDASGQQRSSVYQVGTGRLNLPLGHEDGVHLAGEAGGEMLY